MDGTLLLMTTAVGVPKKSIGVSKTTTDPKYSVFLSFTFLLFEQHRQKYTAFQHRSVNKNKDRSVNYQSTTSQSSKWPRLKMV